MKTKILFIIGVLLNLNLLAQVGINPCAQAKNIHVVVLGSSTAAGSGPSSPDSAWVNRYRKYLQNINPNNQVTNLAIGGTTTYHIMPTWFVPPVGRPTSNPNNNVSRAVILNADAIIVNMPSNDAANGFGINEQMSNFIMIKNTADSAGIPVWVCTTQPRNGFNASRKAIQTGVRDSVLSYFGSYAIDFWTGFADTNSNLLSKFDSGDGVHMNDTAHNVLESLVIAEGIPNVLADTLNYTDHVLSDVFLENHSICGDSMTIIKAVVLNMGQLSANSANLNFEILDNVNSSISNSQINLGQPFASCTSDTFQISINAYSGIDYTIKAYLISTDSIKSNDTSSFIAIRSLGHPQIIGINDTVCEGDSALLKAFTTSSIDTVLWYDSISGGQLLAIGDKYKVLNASGSRTYYPQAVRGNLFYSNSLFTTSATSTNWNGIMFDIVAKDTLILDSIAVKINSTGTQTVVAYSRNGSYVGNENNSAAWSNWGNHVLQVATPGQFMIIDLPNKTINPNDTLGVYLHMQNSGSTLSYQSTSSNVDYSNSEIQILSGSGIAHTFGNIYSPRNFSGEVFYHYGFNPEGFCSTSRIPVKLELTSINLNIGNDTSISWSDSITLAPTSDFSSYLWSDNSTQKSLTIDTSNFLLGPNKIWLEVDNKYGCIASDTVVINISKYLAIPEGNKVNPLLYPNPSNGHVTIKLDKMQEMVVVNITDSKGLLHSSKSYFDTDELYIKLNSNPGIYFFDILLKDGARSVFKVVLK